MAACYSGERSQFFCNSLFLWPLLAAALETTIGLISSNLGATSIETWMSAGHENPFRNLKEVLDIMAASEKL